MFERIREWFMGNKSGAPEMGAPVRSFEMNFSLDGARVDDEWGMPYWGSLTSPDVHEVDLEVLWRRARALYCNVPAVRKCVENMVHFTGVLTPQPNTDDDEWNELAAAAWHARTCKPGTFELTGRLNYAQAMSFIERSAIVDGDCAVRFTRGDDGGALVAIYRAPCIGGGGQAGVESDDYGRVRGYWLRDADGGARFVSAAVMMLYAHGAAPDMPRTVTELLAALRGARDMQDIVRFAKNGVKLSNSMGLVMTSPAEVRGDVIAPRLGARAEVQPDGRVVSVMGTGMTVTPLPAGRDVKPVKDDRPSTQVQEFWKYLTQCIALASGLDPEVVFYSTDMGSAAVRFSLEKVAKWQRGRWVDQEVLCNRLYEHVISCEIASGRLRPCRASAWLNVRWIPDRDMTIDTARVASAQINLVREGLADADDFAVRTTQSSWRELVRKRAADVAYAKMIADKNGLDLAEVLPGSVGASNGRVPTPQYVPDDEPEQVINDEDENG